jgi:glycosyltransferase involved in cell wall biosynthesis
MALGIPVVASPVGVNTEIVISGDNGFLASDPSEWETSLDRLLADAALRQQMGSRGRTMVETSYSAVAHAPRVAAIFREAGR